MGGSGFGSLTIVRCGSFVHSILPVTDLPKEVVILPSIRFGPGIRERPAGSPPCYSFGVAMIDHPAVRELYFVRHIISGSL